MSDDEFAGLRREAGCIACLLTAVVFAALLLLAYGLWGAK